MASKHSQAPCLISQGIFDSIKSFKEFEQKVSALFETNTKAQGDAFEIFVEAYLLTQPITQCAETWLVGSIPVEVREELNLPNDSKGIDGVFKSTNDVLVPYQVKFRSNRPALGFNEVAPFLGITEKAVDRLLITNCDSIAIDVKNRTGIRSLRGVDFDQLTEDDFLVIENWLKAKPTKRAALVPDPYQVEALSNISNHLQSNDRGSVVMACGTGKTLVALWAVEQSKAKSILVLLPSLTLLQQTLSEWSAHNSWGKNFSYLCVCSDPQVDLKNDEIELDTTDVPFKIDTDHEIVKSYLAQENGKTKIVFSTYQSSQVVSHATKDGYTFDIGVFDEAHKTTGISEGRFALALKDENILIKKRLFFTATPKHYDIKKRNKDGEFNFFSMDDESIYGSRAHTLSFSQAADQGIICPYKVVVTLIDKQQIDDFALKNGITLVEGDAVKAKWVASQVAVSSAIKHTNAKKIITFHSRVKTAREFASDEIYGIKKFLPNFDVFHVHGKQRSNERKDTISKFKSSPASLITNAKCLTEGVDVPAVDMVAFVDPRHSKIDIAQAVGRAMRKPRGGNKQLGYIVVPLYAEDTNDQSLETAIQNEGFDDVALIINSLLEQDSELTEIISELKQSKGRGLVFNPKRLRDKVEVIGPYINLVQLETSIFTETIERLGSSWDEWYGCLIKFKDREGNCNVPRDHIENGLKLGIWTKEQRLRSDSLPLNRFKKLDELGFNWDPLNEKWDEGYRLLLKFKEREGHCNVPASYIEDEFKLGQWVGTQRRVKESLSKERYDLLTSAGFSWDPYNEQWDVGFNLLFKFKLREGHCNVPQNYYDDNFYLGLWVARQRKKRLNLSDLQRTKLNEIGFVWDALIQRWNLGIENLLSFKQREGHCVVPFNHVENNFNLGQWVSHRRRDKKHLTEERINQLDEIGFVWEVLDDKWEIGFLNLVNFKNREGHCAVQRNHLEAGFELGIWVKTQRVAKDWMPIERLNRLNQLSFIWNLFDEKWEIGFSHLVSFFKREGHSNVTREHIENGFKLGQWIGQNRTKYENLSERRKQRLEELGFNWDVHKEQWDKGYKLLLKFKERQGHCKVPASHIDDEFKLGQWVGTQRREKSKLTIERYRLLDAIGFIWDPLGEQWDKGVFHLIKFKEREGHCSVRYGHIENGFKLGLWVSNKRKEFDKLSAERVNQLNLMGFIW